MIDLRKVTVTPHALALVPGTLARRLKCLPLMVNDGALTVAVRDTSDYGVLDQLQQRTGLEIRPLPASDPDMLETALRRYYPSDAAGEDNAPALFRGILHRAVQIRASDIHLDPAGEGGAVRVRVDGALRVDRELSAEALGELISAVKVMAGMDIAERRVPHDGQFETESAGEKISLRVASIPVIHGEKVTLRLLGSEKEETLASLDMLGMSKEHYEIFGRALGVSNGVLLLTGPTGSGKTTTLYAALRRLAAPMDSHILSIEDPVEIPVSGVNQVRVRHEEGLTGFHRALRSALRHDPDIIMIGEIRDAESADIAVKAAMTGHLVLSTLHTNDAVGVITRLKNLDVPPYLISATLRLAAAQRLVRTPCPHCVASARPPAEVSERMGLEPGETAAEAKECPLCGHIGYAGRTGLFEMVPVDDGLRELILAGAGEIAMRRYVFAEGGQPTLLQDGLSKIRQGVTTPAEVDRAVLIGV